MRGQISLEIIITVSLVILIFLGFFIFYIDKNREIKNLDEVLELRDECFRISNAIGNAITLGEGYSAELQLLQNTTMRLNEGTISIESEEGTDTTCSYRGDVVSGTYNSTINITNTNNIITIQNV